MEIHTFLESDQLVLQVLNCLITLALAAVLAFPGTKASYWIDRIGSMLVSLYMIRCGIKTILEQRETENPV